MLNLTHRHLVEYDVSTLHTAHLGDSEPSPADCSLCVDRNTDRLEVCVDVPKNIHVYVQRRVPSVGGAIKVNGGGGREDDQRRRDTSRREPASEKCPRHR